MAIRKLVAGVWLTGSVVLAQRPSFGGPACGATMSGARGGAPMAMTVKCQTFVSGIKSWEKLAAEAAAFATQVGQQRLINISVSATGGADLIGYGAEGVIFVWYWE